MARRLRLQRALTRDALLYQAAVPSCSRSACTLLSKLHASSTTIEEGTHLIGGHFQAHGVAVYQDPPSND